MSPLDRNPGRHVYFSRAGWLRWRLSARLGLLLYAAGWTVQRQYLRLRAALPRRPGMTRPVPPVAAPEGTAPAPTPLNAGAVPPITRDGLTVIRAGGMLLPGRPRETPEPMGFRIPPYYTGWERQQAARRWMP